MSTSRRDIIIKKDNVSIINFEPVGELSKSRSKRGYTLEVPFPVNKVEATLHPQKLDLEPKMTVSRNKSKISFDINPKDIKGKKAEIEMVYDTKTDQLIKLGSIARISGFSTLSNIVISGNALMHSTLPPIKKKFQPLKMDLTFTPKNLHNNDTRFKGDAYHNPVAIEIGKMLDYVIKQEYTVKTSHNIKNVKIAMRIPHDSHYQHVDHFVEPDESGVSENDDGNYFVHWELDTMKRGTHKFIITNEVQRTPEIFFEKEYGTTLMYLGSNKKYLDTNEQWDIGKKDLKKMDTGFSRTSNVFKIVVEVFEFVNNYIKYTITGGRQPASKTLEREKGDCTEYSDLMVNLLRIRKIPARLAFGHVVDLEKHSLEGHAWVEFMTPDRNWHAVDPTWGCLGGIDSSFILSGYDLGFEDDNIEQAVKLNYSSNDSAKVTQNYQIKLVEMK